MVDRPVYKAVTCVRMVDLENERIKITAGKEYGRENVETTQQAPVMEVAEKVGSLSGNTETDRSGSSGYSKVKEFQSYEGVYSAWQCDSEFPRAECGAIQYSLEREPAYPLQQERNDQRGIAA